MGERGVVLKQQVACRASAGQIFAELADTERLNRFMGNGALTVRAVDDDRLARFEMDSRIGGVPVTYEETPYCWYEGRYFSFRRELRGGPALDIDVRYDFTPASEGSVVSVSYASKPRLTLFWPLVWVVTWRSLRRVCQLIALLDRQLMGGEALPLPQHGANSERLGRLRRSLELRHEPALVRQLVELLRSSTDLELQRLRPFELADAWGAPRRLVLALCLDAASIGLLELHWSLVCPSCQTTSVELPRLEQLQSEGHCHACDIRFGVEFDRVVEATFSPHPSVRPIERRPYCIAGPGLMRHIVTQELLPRAQAIELVAPTQAGEYRLFARGGASAEVEVRADASSKLELALAANRFNVSRLVVAPEARLRVQGDDRHRHVKIERLSYRELAATAWHVTLLPEFRELFGSEALRPGLSLSVSSVTLLFSDLVGSTALYAKLGDAAAFGVVTDALRFGSERVELQSGVVVKTMGDAVMAAFATPEQAYASAAAMLRDWGELQRSQPLAQDLALKIGFWTGPCTVVSANGVIDYFGQTVNTAARVQGVASAGELVLGVANYEELKAGARFAGDDLVLVERFDRQVKGIEEPLALVRLRVA